LLARYRSQARLTQEELGARSGYSANYIGKLERDQRNLPAAALDRLATILALADEERAALRAARDRRRGGDQSARPLAGREPELAELHRQLAGLGPAVLLFAGEPGIGKTRLLEEAASRAAQSGWRVVQGGSQRRAQDPYAPLTGALLDALERLSAGERAHALRQAAGLELLLPELTAADQTAAATDDRAGHWVERTVEPEQRRRLLFSAVERFLGAVAGEAGVLLVLDDLQWAGPDSLDLLATLFAAPRASAVRLIGAYRDSETDASRRLREFVADLAHSSRVRVCALEPLSPTESEQLATQLIADAAAIRAVLPAIVRRAGGIPFFLVSFVEDLPAAGQGTPPSALPWTVRQVIGQRVSALPESAQELLAVAAVVGRLVSHSLMVGASSRPEDEVLAALEAAATARLVTEDEQGGYRFTHDLIRETIEDGLSGGRRRLLHRRVANTLEREGHAAAETLAFHFALSDDEDKAIAYLELAGDEADRRVAYAAAAEFFQQTLDRLQAAGQAQRTAPLSEKLGVALYRGGHYDEAITALEAALAGYRTTGDEDSLHRLTGRLADAHFRRGTSDDALDEAVSLAEQHDLVPATAASDSVVARWQGLVRLIFARGAYKRLVTVGRPLARAGRATGNAKLERLGTRVEAGGLIYLGRVREGIALMEATMPLDPVAARDDRAPEAAVLLSAAQLSIGSLESSRAVSERMLRAAESAGDALIAAMHSVLLATIHYVQGDWQHGQVLLRNAQERLNVLGPSPHSLRMVPALGQTLTWAGDWQQARFYLETAIHTAHSLRAPELEHAAVAQLAQLDLLEGQPEAALASLQPRLTKDLPWSYAVPLLTTLAAAQLELGDPARALQHAEKAVAEARRTEGWVNGIRALEVLGTVEAHRGNHDLSDAPHQEALKRARAIPFPYAEAHILHASGQLDRARGDGTSAQAKLNQALAIFERLGAKRETANLRETTAQTDTPTP
jgi:tetratricopeptide (TPR) repeat protein